MTTIYDVAQHGGVSPATVSRVLNGIPVSAESERKVRQAAAELGFVPDRTARRLRTKSSDVIALLIPDIENPFFTALARGVQDRAHEHGLSLVLCNSDDLLDREQRYLDIALAEHMGGIVLAPASPRTDLARWTSRNLPVVVVDRELPGADLDTVLVDNEGGGRAATAALYEAGHSIVACITGPTDVYTAVRRAAGWQEVFLNHHRRLDPARYLRHADYRHDGGSSAMASLLSMSDPPDAVFVANNLMTAGALATLWSEGAAPPTVGLASFGGLPYGFGPVPVTVVDLPARELGVRAADLLVRRMGDPSTPTRRVVLGLSDDDGTV